MVCSMKITNWFRNKYDTWDLCFYIRIKKETVSEHTKHRAYLYTD